MLARSISRWCLVVLLACCLPLAACGKKGKLRPEEGSTYPQSYPSQ